MKKKILKFGLIKGRHNLPVEDYIFDNNLNPVDVAGMEEMARRFFAGYDLHEETHIYVTGLTTALIAVLNALSPATRVTLWHYDREKGGYFPQPVYFGRGEE